LIGALLFAAVSERSGAPPGFDERPRLVVPAHRVAQALEEFERLTKRPPTPGEAQTIARTIVDDEILFRHALRLGLDKEAVVERRLAMVASFVADDPSAPKSAEELAGEAVSLGLHEGDQVARRMLIDGARRLIRAAVLAREPNQELLADYLREHPEEFQLPGEVRLSHVTLGRNRTEDEAREMLARLRADSLTPEEIRTLRGGVESRDLPPLPEREIERRFGRRFVEQLAGLPAGSWEGPIPSRDGLQLVFVHDRTPPRVPELAEVRKDVRARARQKLADDWLEARLAELRAEVEIVIEGIGPS
jgi:hypothetical protein